MKQASLRDSTCSLIERGVEPLGSLNKYYTARTSCGLPFNAPYARTGMHEVGDLPFLTILSQSIHTPLCSQSLTQPGGGRSWAYSPSTLPNAREREEMREETETQAKQTSMHSCVCSNLSTSPLFIVQSSNQSLYSMFALLHGSSSVSRDKQCAFYLVLRILFRILEFFLLEFS